MATLAKKGKRWYAVLSEHDNQGRRKQVWVSLKTERKREAEVRLADLVTKQQKGEFVRSNRMPLAEYLETWLERLPGLNIRQRTVDGYEEKMRNHVIPYLGAIPIRDLEPDMIQALYRRLLLSGRKDGKGGLAPQTVRLVHRTLSEALTSAVKLRLLARNPAEAATAPRVKRKDINTLDEAGVYTLLNMAKTELGGLYYEMLFLDLYTGIRRSELLGLRWCDTDLDFAAISIVQSLHLPKGYKTPIIEETKPGGSRRQISLSPDAVAVLREHKSNQVDMKADLGVWWDEKGFVFCKPDGSPFLPNSVTHAYLKIARRAGLEGVRLHDLRHSHATLMLKAGIHPKIVQERLGHSSISMTLDTYSHVVPGLQEQAALRFEEGLKAHKEQADEVPLSVG